MKKIILKKIKYIIPLIPIILLALGIIIRIMFTIEFGVRETYSDFTGVQTYTHDTPYHSQYIQYVAQNLSLPEVDKGLEYPQQPLYYIITGFSYKILGFFLSSSDKIFKALVWFSTLFSIGSLVFVFFTAKKVAQPIWLQSFIVGLFAFTPSFVFQSIRISNDPLLTFLTSGAFFFLIKYIKEEKHSQLLATIFFSILAIFTKISGGILILLIIFALIYKYKQKNSEYYLKMMFIVFIIGFLCLGSALYRSYIPSTKEFRFVESYSYVGQRTYPKSFTYFFDFNFIDLKNEAQSYIFGNENVAKTLPTFLYGSFLFGESDYSNVITVVPAMKTLMQIIIFLGLLFPIGIIINFIFIEKWNLIDYISALGSAICLWLIISFLYKYPSVCNSDFRYFSPIFSGLIVLSSLGLYRLSEKLKKYKIIIPILCISLISSEFIWVIARIAIKTFLQT